MLAPMPRTATAADLPALLALINLAFLAEEPWAIGDRLDADELAHYLQKGELLVVDDGGAPVACVYVAVEPDGAGYLGLLSVHPSQQGKGLGSRLIGHAETWARGKGCTRMELQIIDVREELLAYYGRHGYAVADSRPVPPELQASRFRQPTRFVRMAKPL
jgi:GNAT superfamily N-acetyltransferase